MVIVVCFVGGMLYYSMNVLWPQQSNLLFVPPNQPLIRGAYANIFSFGSLCKFCPIGPFSLELTIYEWVHLS